MLRSLTVSTRVLTPGCAALQERSTPAATAPATVTTKAATAKLFRLIGAITVDGENLPNNVKDFLPGESSKEIISAGIFFVKRKSRRGKRGVVSIHVCFRE